MTNLVSWQYNYLHWYKSLLRLVFYLIKVKDQNVLVQWKRGLQGSFRASLTTLVALTWTFPSLICIKSTYSPRRTLMTFKHQTALLNWNWKSFLFLNKPFISSKIHSLTLKQHSTFTVNCVYHYYIIFFINVMLFYTNVIFFF